MTPAPVFSTDFLLVAYRPDLHQLTGRWQRSITEAELHQGYQALRQAALHHNCRYWLIDARRRISRSFNGPEWVASYFLPQMQRELSGHLCVAFLVLPDYLHNLPTPAPGTPATPDDPLQIARFLDEGAANTWLAGWQATEPR
jgi:hypothetical protein